MTMALSSSSPSKSPSLAATTAGTGGEAEEAHMAAFTGHDPEFAGLSRVQRKCILVDRELDRMGMGRYQWYIWLLCGLGYFLDLLWAQAFGLVATPLQQELGFSSTQLGNIFSSFSAGLCAGAFVWGVLVDIIGRKWSFNGTVLLTCIFGLFLGVPDSYDAILVITAFVGFGIGGNIPIDTTICMEFLPKNRRFLLAMLSVFQPLGVVVCSGIAYGFVPHFNCLASTPLPSCSGTSLVPPACLPSCLDSTLAAPGAPCCSKADNYGWRYLMFTLGGISLFVFVARFLVFNFQESPKFLLSKGRDAEAVAVLQAVAKTNGTTCGVRKAMFRAVDEAWEAEQGSRSSSSSDDGSRESFLADDTRKPKQGRIAAEFSRIAVLFSTPTLARLTILVWIIYAFDYWGFSIAGAFLPTILARKNAALSVSIASTYASYIIIHLPGIPGVALAALLYRFPTPNTTTTGTSSPSRTSALLSRRTLLFASALLMALSLFLFTRVRSQAAYVGLNATEYFFQSMFNAVLYGWTPEAFPTPVRGTASGVASFWGRLVGIVAPLVAARLLEGSLDAPLYLAGGGVCVAAVAILLLPRRGMVVAGG